MKGIAEPGDYYSQREREWEREVEAFSLDRYLEKEEEEEREEVGERRGEEQEGRREGEKVGLDWIILALLHRSRSESSARIRFVLCLWVQREENAKNEEGTREEEEDASSRKLLQFRFRSTPSSESSAFQTDFSKR